MAALTTRKSNPNKPARVIIYGPEGAGKSTFGAKSDKPIFITPEGGADRLTDSEGNPVEELPGVNTWLKLIAGCNDILNQDHDFKTLVLDSADWMESLCHAEIIGRSGKSITTVNGGYGAGFRQSQGMHKELIDILENIRNKRGMNLIITAHAHVKPVKDPEMLEDYDSFEIKCHEYVSSLWREWVDALFFVRFKTFLSTSDDSVKARALTDGTRVIYTQKQPAFQAKNRFGMPPEMDFTENFWNEFMQYAKKGVVPTASLDELKMEIQDLKMQLTDEATLKLVDESFVKAGDNMNTLVAIKNRLKEILKK